MEERQELINGIENKKYPSPRSSEEKEKKRNKKAPLKLVWKLFLCVTFAWFFNTNPDHKSRWSVNE